MPDKKLTDSEIVKALNTALGMEHISIYCANIKNEVQTIRVLDIIDLINRLQAENKILRKFKAYFDFYYGCDVEILGIDEDGNTTSFDEFYNCAIANTESIEHHIAHIIKTAKAEAYKEFDECLKEDCLSYPLETEDITMLVNVDRYNNLLKELVGDSVADTSDKA